MKYTGVSTLNCDKTHAVVQVPMFTGKDWSKRTCCGLVSSKLYGINKTIDCKRCVKQLWDHFGIDVTLENTQGGAI